MQDVGSADVTDNTDDVGGISDTRDMQDTANMGIFTFLHYLLCIGGGYSV